MPVLPTPASLNGEGADLPRQTIDFDAAVRATADLMFALGLDATAPGLVDTPIRVANWWREFMEYDPGKTDTVFELAISPALARESMSIVGVKGIRVWSVCEHHLLPFWCDISIAYVPSHDHRSHTQNVLGLSKLARIAHECAHYPQMQERLVQQIAQRISHILETPDVAVIGQGEHLCMTMRGIKSEAMMFTTAFYGTFADSPLRREVMELLK